MCDQSGSFETWQNVACDECDRVTDTTCDPDAGYQKLILEWSIKITTELGSAAVVLKLQTFSYGYFKTFF